MVLLSPFLILLGFFLPGSLIARRLGHPLWWASGFLFSLLILFHCVFWTGLLDIPIRLQTILPCLAAICAAAAWWARGSLKPVKTAEAAQVRQPPENSPRRGSKKPAKTVDPAQWDTTDRVLLLASALAGLALVARAALSPLIGFDTTFRWDFLAQRILALGNFSYYPPLTPEDFRAYFYVDGIPPLVSFGNWWIYASAGRHQPALLAVFVAAQFACTLAFTYGAAAALFSRRAGVLAAAALAACPLFFNAVVIEQETGLTALGIAATLYFLVRAKLPGDVPAMAAAGLAAAVTALSREYGWIAVAAGVVVLLWRRFPWQQAAIFAAVAIVAAGPWYLRNWAIAGNPLYSMRVGPFAVNPIHDGIMQYYQTVFGPGRWTPDALGALVGLLLTLAPLQLIVGIPGAATRFRERGYLAVTAALLGVVWLQSIGFTSGGVDKSMRVLSPALAVLSIAAAGILERWRTAAAAVILAFMAWTVAQGSVFPGPFSTWPEASFQALLKPTEFQIADQLAGALPAGSRILTDNAYMHAALADRGIDVVPVWSPEVRFLYSSPPEESDRRLRELRIGTIAYYPGSLNTRYLSANSKFYAELPRRWRTVADIPGTLTIFQP
jgi:hypothetical protein